MLNDSVGTMLAASSERSQIYLAVANRLIGFDEFAMDRSEPSVVESPNDVADWVQVDGDTAYNPASYLAPSRLASIGHQVSYLHRYFPDSSVLEVGVGSGMATDLARRMGHRVSTLDVDAKLFPTILASVTEIPVEEGAFDAFSCCQVLEHLRWEDAQRAISELRRIAALGGVISVPTSRPRVGIRVFPYSGSFATLMLPNLWPRRWHINCPEEHQWELGLGVSVGRFRRAIRGAGFRIDEERQPIENPYHHFFVVTRC